MGSERRYIRIRVPIATADGTHWRDGYDAGVPGLAVHRSKRVGGMGWTVTHEESGYSILPARTKREALELARQLGALVDWTKSREVLQRNARVIGRCRAIQKRSATPTRGGRDGK